MTHFAKAPEAPELAAPAHQFSVQLPATRRSAHLARTLATDQLRAWCLPSGTAAQIVAELAANAVLHGRVPGRDFRLTLTAPPDGGPGSALRIEVTDTRPDRLPALPRSPSDTAESGRGLLLVTALATRWGVTPGPIPTKTVWAELDLDLTASS